MSNLGSCSSGNEDASMTELSAYVLEPIREGPDFTLYRGRQHGGPIAGPSSGTRCGTPISGA